MTSGKVVVASGYVEQYRHVWKLRSKLASKGLQDVRPSVLPEDEDDYLSTNETLVKTPAAACPYHRPQLTATSSLPPPPSPATTTTATAHPATGPLPFSQMPGPKPSLPLIGTNWIYFPFVGHYQSMKLHEANLDKFDRYGAVMKEEYQRGHPAVTIFDLKEIRKVLRNESGCPARPVLPYVIQHRLSDPSRYPNVGLANMMGNEWLKLRSQLAPLLLSEELKKRYILSQNWVTNRLVRHIEHSHGAEQATGEPLVIENMQEMFYRFSLESIMNLCLNQRLECLQMGSKSVANATLDSSVRRDGEQIFQAAMDLFEAQHKLYYGSSWWKYFNTKSYRQACDSQDTIHDIVSKYIDRAKSDLDDRRSKGNRSGCGSGGGGGGAGEPRVAAVQCEQGEQLRDNESLMETLYSANRFSDLEIKSTIVDFIGGGIYTVANTLTMTLFLLAANPLVQERLYEEICRVFSDANDDDMIHVDLDKLEQMKFLKMCLKEANRLLPTIPGIARTLHEDMVLSNYDVPKGTLVFCNLMVACRLPQYFEQPDTFNPLRWERNGEPLGELAFSVLPFGHGKRKCIGHNFAKLEINVALVKLIKSFKVSTVNNQNLNSLDLSYKFIVVPEKPVALKFQPR